MPSQTELKVLLVEDEEDSALLTRAILGSLPGAPVTCTWVSSVDEGIHELLKGVHDVCLLDYHLDGDAFGTELLRRARARAIHTPVILLTGKGSRSVDLEAMAAGAADYLQKGKLDPEMLERSLRYAVERHRALEALRRSEERNRDMFDHLPLGLFRVSMEGDYQEANPALIRILEQPDRAYLQDTLARNYFVAADDRGRFLSALGASDAITGFESRVLSGRGRPLLLRISARVHRGPAGEPEYVEGAVEDLTGASPAHRSDEDAASFRTLATSGELGIFRTDPEGQIRWVNEVAARLLETSPRALLGQGIWNVVHPAEQDRIARAFEELAAGTRDRSEREVRILGAGGVAPALRMTMTAVTGKAGSLQSILGTLWPAESRAPSPTG